MQETRKEGWLLPILLAALVIGWSVMGWCDLSQATQAGFETDGDNTIVRVLPDSPASSSGLLRGDVITRVGNISAENAAALARLPRARPGEVRNYTVLRDGEAQTVAVRFGPLLPRTLSLSRASSIIGLCFLLFPLLAWYRRPAEATRVLTVMGVGLSFAFIGGPYIAEAGLRSVVLTVTTLFMLSGVAAMAQFLLVFPRRRPWLERAYGKFLLYLPAVVLWALLAYRLLFTPTATSALNTVTNLMAGVVVGGYFLLALFLVLRNYSRTDRAQRRALALNGMLWGTVFGLLPATVAQLVTAFSPQSVLPGQDFYFVSLALIPLSWSRSASRGDANLA
ncbi:PDZ domain-containing protein [Elongatibacter sediminis]|uniref:PDZ domain-containing protein n=1 Tax=Elongatibacter sediminis TaxID=3119006 RepID=A0AAW9RF51_9GAMM